MAFWIFVLTYTGIESLLSAGKIEVNARKAKDSLFSSFLTGFIMSLSNPLSILFWLGFTDPFSQTPLQNMIWIIYFYTAQESLSAS
ncbi:LysE family transporter [[Brevibacterium] frigoritolerans]|uniref:LysE family transporter n=1 Tax=Peribacillus frigoritolerans TaxID=450367 RepID=A0A941FQL1_9BACI|nr:LysE family transporter [Peribacillus frigoritolerans]